MPFKSNSYAVKKGGYYEKKIMMLMITFILLITAGFVFGAEMAKEGSGKGIVYYTSTSQVLAQGKENVVFNYEARGVSGTDDETNPLLEKGCWVSDAGFWMLDAGY